MKRVFTFAMLVLFAGHALGQTETFDIATYTPPKDWKKDSKDGAVIYSNANTSTGTFCVLSIYASTPSTGDPQTDFKNKWKDQVATPYKVAADPKTEMQTSPDGWKAVAGAAAIKDDGIDAYVILTVFSGFGKTLSVLATFNDQSYAGSIDDVLGQMTLDKTGKVAVIDNIASPQITGDKLKLGSMLYNAPAGWKTTRYPDGDILVPADLPKNEFLEIWVMQPMSFSGTLEQALQKSYDETVVKLQGTKMNDVNGGSYSAIAAKKSFRGWDYIRCSGGLHIGAGEYPAEYGLDLFLIKINDRFEQVAVVKTRFTCGYSRYYASDKLNYYNDIENFLFSLQFSDWKEPVVTPASIRGDGIAGVWEGISLSVGMSKPGASLGAEYKVKDAVFFSNGQVLFATNFPKEGLAGLNTWVKAEQNRRDWGTYTFSNGKGVIHLPYEDIPLRMENNKLILTTNKADHGFIKLNPVDGAKFNGTYVFSSKNMAGEETGKTPTINFTADGSFTDNGGLSILYHEYADCLNAAKEPGSGTYEINNFSIVFNYTDGRKVKIAFLGHDYDKKDQSPATLTLSTNEDVFHKK